MCCTYRSIFVCLAAVATLTADVTVRYSYDLKPGAMIPPPVAEKMRAQMKEIMPESGMVTQLKGNRAYSKIMGMTSISDFDGAMITLIDAKNKKYSTVEAAAYGRTVADHQEAAMKQIPEDAKKAMEALKMSTDVRRTGQTKTFAGIRATEIEMTMSVEMPGPAGTMRSVISMWVADKEEAERNPALRELAFFTRRAYEGTNPSGVLEKAMGQAHGMFSGIKKLMEEMKDAPALLSMHVASYAPGIAALAQAKGETTVDPNAPMMEIVMEIQELSTAEVPASVFEIPRDYTSVPMNELLTGVMPKMPAR